MERFPRQLAPLLPLIAPLWADFNFREAGSLYYRVTNDSTTLRRATQEISRENQDFSNYSPTLAIVVTWFEAVLLQDNTFSVISNNENECVKKYVAILSS